MDDGEWLAQRLEAHRAHLRAVAYRLLGSTTEADDAVQEAWLRWYNPAITRRTGSLSLRYPMSLVFGTL